MVPPEALHSRRGGLGMRTQEWAAPAQSDAQHPHHELPEAPIEGQVQPGVNYLLVSTHAPLCKAETEHACQETHVRALCIASIHCLYTEQHATACAWCATNRDKPMYMRNLGALGACSGCRPTATAATTLIGSLPRLAVFLQDLVQRCQEIAFQLQPVPPLFLELHERPLCGNKKPAFWRCLKGAFRPKKLPYPPLDTAEALGITGMNLQKGLVPNAGDKRTKGARSVKVSDPAICLSGLLSAARGCQAGGRKSTAVGTVAHLNTWLATACWPALAAAF